MCGRINVSDHPGVQQLLKFLDMPYVTETQFKKTQAHAQYNIAPSSLLLTAFTNRTAYMSWGIIPELAKPDQFSRPLINARADSIWEKPSFQQLIKTNRIIIPVNGFYEWNRANNHNNKNNNKNNNKTAFHIHSNTQPAMALAGIYQITKGVMQCSIITTEANQAMSSIHHRMPVILEPANFSDWLQSNDKETLNSLMIPCPDERISIDPVSSYVNSTRNQGPDCVKPAEKPKQQIEKQLNLL